MTNITSLFDAYSRKARLYPALIAALPVTVAIVVCFPAASSGIGGILLSLIAASGGFYALANLARSRGKKIEPLLLRQWGGWPTTAWLRHGDSRLPAATKARYHKFLSERTGLVFPSPPDEMVGPERADSTYESSVHWLKEQCRGKEFSMVEKENADYGFRRNLLGLKSIGLFLSVAGILLALGLEAINVYIQVKSAGSPAVLNVFRPEVFGSVMLSIVMVLFWHFVVRADWVREAGDQYARALLANCDSLK